MVSALADSWDRVRGLDAGADDYLTKPFNPRELHARTQAVLRRCTQSSRHSAALTYLFGDWRFETSSRQLTHKDGQVARLKEAEFNVLMSLLSQAHRVLSRSQLDRRFAVANPFDRTVDMHISRLRKLLRDRAQAPDLIQTLRGKSYVLKASVRVE